MLKTTAALRQLMKVKLSGRQLMKSGDSVRVREKMSEDEINVRRRQNIASKIWAEYDVLDCYDDSFLKLDRWNSKNFEEMKSLYKDLKKYNRENGIAPTPGKYPKRRPLHMFGNPKPDSWMPRTDDIGVIESAQLAVNEYNKQQHGSSLEFVSVLSIEIRSNEGDCNFLIQTRDPAAAGVSINLHAHCYWPYRDVYQVSLHRPVSFINLVHKDERNKAGDGDVEVLLYANLHNCPVIRRRLGLKRENLHYGNSRGLFLNLSLDDDSLIRVAQFAVNQRSNIHLLRVTGAWREQMALRGWQKDMTDRRYLYHVIFEALEHGLQRRFYSAISVDAEAAAPKLLDLVPLHSPRPTTKIIV
ncbi:uncharacterized protein LOC141587328 [Silene latifolia]|uniref:uncharacterized protein LOC141587328 n=1 Tax=Silene latifolia TaxID=37657 RepID=UPI003D77A236